MTSILPQGRAREMARPEVEELAQSLEILQAGAVRAGMKRSHTSWSIPGWGTWEQSLGAHKKYLAGSEILHEPLSELVTSAVQRFINSTDETPSSGGGETNASRKTYILYEPSNQRKAQVFRFVLDEDILLSLRGGIYVNSGRHLVEQGFADLGHGMAVSWRSFESQTLNDRIHSMDDGVPTPQAFKQRLAILQRILAGLEELRENGQVHGDLRPTNVAFPKVGEVRLLDYATRPTLSILSREQRTYLAPEADEEPTPASDIYSFGMIAQRLVGNYLWNDSYTPAHVDNSSLAWILELCTQKDPSVRPSIAQIRETLFPPVRDKKFDSVASGAGAIPDKRYLNSLILERVQSDSPDEIAKHPSLAEYPETSLLLWHSQIQSDLHSLVRLDTPVRETHNRAQEVPQEGRSVNGIEREPHQFPKQIDEQMKDGIHRLHFGFGLSPSHDESLPKIRRRSRLASRQADYQSHLRQADAARNRLLASDQYLYSSDVATVLGFGDSAASLATVALLRRWGSLAAVKDHERWLHPAFQFHPETGAISPHIRSANQVMADNDPWGTLSWWFFPRVSLGGAALASILHDPEHDKDIRSAIDRLKR